jgi:hypothetical protein
MSNIIMILSTILMLSTSSYGLKYAVNYRQRNRNISKIKKFPEYEIPNWVYKKVFHENQPVDVTKYEKLIDKYQN